MKKKFLFSLTLITLTFILCGSAVKVAQAGSISVGTYDAAGSPKDVFSIGEAVRIIATSNASPIIITIWDPDGIVAYTNVFPGDVDEILTDLTQKHGMYTVQASSPFTNTITQFSTTYFFIVPEIPLGTLGALSTLILSLGFLRVRTQ